MNLQNITLDPFTYLGVLFIILVLFVVVVIQSIKLYKRAIQIATSEDEMDALIYANYESDNLLQKSKEAIDDLIAKNKALSEVTKEAIEALKKYKNGREKV